MNGPLLIIVSGLPATGKTTISKELAKEFSLPSIGKDTIKEVRYIDTFDTFNDLEVKL